MSYIDSTGLCLGVLVPKSRSIESSFQAISICALIQSSIANPNRSREDEGDRLPTAGRSTPCDSWSEAKPR